MSQNTFGTSDNNSAASSNSSTNKSNDIINNSIALVRIRSFEDNTVQVEDTLKKTTHRIARCSLSCKRNLVSIALQINHDSKGVLIARVKNKQILLIKQQQLPEQNLELRNVSQYVTIARHCIALAYIIMYLFISQIWLVA